jgi:hypothetical protein
VKKRRAKKPPYRSLSSVDCSGESTLASKPIERTAAAREHPDLQAHASGSAKRLDATLRDVKAEDPLLDAERGLEEVRRRERERVLGEPLTPAERAFLVDKCRKNRTEGQI